MKSTTTIKDNRLQAISQFWTPLPDCQQEMLSGGAPKVPPPPPPPGGGGNANSQNGSTQ